MMFNKNKLAKKPNTTFRAGVVGLSALALGVGGATAIATTASAAERTFTLENTALRSGSPTGSEIPAGSNITAYQSGVYFATDLVFGSSLNSGDTFTVDMDFDASQVNISATTFPLAYSNGDEYGTCIYSGGTSHTITCSVDNRVQPGTTDVWMWFAFSSRENSEGTRVDFKVENWEYYFISRPTGGGGPGPVIQPFGKNGSPQEGNLLREGAHGYWTIRVGDAGEALAALPSVTVTDTLLTGTRVEGGMTYHLMPQRYAYLDQWTAICWSGSSGASHPIPAEWNLQFNDSMTSFTMTIDPNNMVIPCGIEDLGLTYFTEIVGPLLYNTPGATEVFGYGNSVEAGGFTDTHYARRNSEGGTSAGVPNTAVLFNIAKALTGDEAANIPTGTTFTVEVQVEGEANPRTITLPMNGDSRPSGPITDDLDITIREINLPQIDGIEWGTPTLSGDTVIDNGDGTFSIDPNGGQTVELTLTNTANTPVVPPTFGSLEVLKTVDGPAPANVNYGFTVTCDTLTYTGTAPAGGSFTVENIPAGLDCTVTETNTHGAKSIAYSVDSVTIAANATATVTVTNTFEPTVVPPVEPPIRGGESDGGGGTPPVLSSTGFETNYPLLITIATLIAAGGALLVARKKLQEN